MIEKAKLVKIVGAGNVTYDQAVLDGYSKDVSFVNAIKPVCVVRPKNAGEVQKIVNLANKSKTPLVPVSSGPPHFRGDTVPGIGGAIIVDLSKMKKIINVDRARRVAMVEPGVTFGELIAAAKKEGIRLNMPLLPRKSKTVIGSLLEREPVTMPKYQWDISDPLACIEVIFGCGDEFRTGQAAGPGTVKEQWAVGGVQKAPYGPGVASWHRLVQGAQGTIGIVTWASMRCELLPSQEEPFVVGADTVDTLVEMASWMVRLRMVNECFILNNTNLAAILAKKWPADYQNLKDGLPAWVLFYTVAGYEYFADERISAHVKGITDITRRLGIEAVKSVGGVSANEILKVIQKPSTEPYWKLRYKGACEDIPYLTINDKLGGQLETMYDLAEKASYSASDMGVYIQPIVQGTGCHCEFNLFYDPANASEANRVKGLATSAVKGLMDNGAFFSRPYGENAGMIINRDAATVAVLKKLKNMFDPNYIMNPGKVCF
ncbi:MAG: FAD-binding oxidoreductase [Dehalococcoidales bacterium]|nr:FAD-binding oxidoreductase [Dehalococcoidales bacterium]